jgi:hypothetical protein
MALAIGPPVIIPFLLFGGFFLNNRYLPPGSTLSCDVMRNVTIVIRHSSDIVVRDLTFGKIFNSLCHPERNPGPPSLLVSECRKDFSEEILSRDS